MIKKTIYLYLFFILLSKFSIFFIAATYSVFLEDHGLDVFWRNIVNAIFYITLFVCEIPTGAFADIFGRKTSYALSYFILSISMFVYGASSSFAGFVVAEIIGAIGNTFANGAFDAWLKDKLDLYGCEKSRLRIVFSRKSQITQIAGGVSGLIGGFLAKVSPTLPWIFGGTFFLIGGVLVIFLLKEEYFEKKKVSIKESILFTKNAVKQGFQNNVICFVVVMTLVQIPTLQAPNMQWPQFFLGFVTKPYLGCIYFGIAITIVAGSFLSIRFLEKMKNSEKKFLIFSQLLMGAGLVLTYFGGTFLLCLPAFLLHEFARGLFAPIKDDYINQSIPEKTKERSILLSIESMSRHLGGIVGLILSGLVAKYSSIPTTWLIFGGFLVIATLLIPKNGRK